MLRDIGSTHAYVSLYDGGMTENMTKAIAGTTASKVSKRGITTNHFEVCYRDLIRTQSR